MSNPSVSMPAVPIPAAPNPSVSFTSAPFPSVLIPSAARKWRLIATGAVLLASTACSARAATRPELSLAYLDSLRAYVLQPMLRDSSACEVNIETARAMLRNAEPGRLPQDVSGIQAGNLLRTLGWVLATSPCLQCGTARRPADLRELVDDYRSAVLRYCNDPTANAIHRIFLLYACTNLYEEHGGIWREGFRLLASDQIQPKEGCSWEQEVLEVGFSRPVQPAMFSIPPNRLVFVVDGDWRLDQRFELAVALFCRERPDWEEMPPQIRDGWSQWLNPKKLRRCAIAPAEKALDEVLNQYAEKHDGRLPDRLWDESGPAESELIREWLDRPLDTNELTSLACWFLGGWPGYRLVEYTTHGNEWFLTVEGVEPGQREVLMGKVRAR